MGPVGETVGSHEGRPVGLIVGLLGVNVGVGVGLRVGSFRAVGLSVGTAVGIGVGCDDGSLAKTINCASSFVVAFPLESFAETVVVVSSKDPQVVDRIPQSSNAIKMYMAPLLFDSQITLLY